MSKRAILINLASLGVVLALLGLVYWQHTGARAVPGLIEDLQSGDAQRQVLAAEALKAIGLEAESAIGPLVDAATLPSNPSLSNAAAGALPAIDLSAARKVMNAWTPKLQDPDGQVRRDAASVLGALGPVAKPAVASLVAALNDRDVLVRDRATRAIGGIGIPIDLVTRGLLQALRDPEWSVRHAAVMQFAFNEFSKEEALPLLRELTADPNHSVAQLAQSAIASRDRPIQTDTYVLMLKQGMNRPYALHQLAKQGPRAADAAPIANAILTNEHPLERYLAVCMLEAIGAQTRIFIKQSTNDPDPVVRETALDALRFLESSPGGTR